MVHSARSIRVFSHVYVDGHISGIRAVQVVVLSAAGILIIRDTGLGNRVIDVSDVVSIKCEIGTIAAGIILSINAQLELVTLIY